MKKFFLAFSLLFFLVACAQADGAPVAAVFSDEPIIRTHAVTEFPVAEVAVYTYEEIEPHAGLMPYGVRDFPLLRIYSELDPFDIERELWHSGYASVSGASPAYNFTGARITLRGRGNSTWGRGVEKRPLRLRFDEPRAMLDSGHEAQDWILLANLFDFSLLRNYAAFYLANLLDGMDFAPFSRFVHLYVNGEYWGVYQLADERDGGEGRAELIFDPDPAVSEHIFEMDFHSSGRSRYPRAENIEGEDFFVAGERWYRLRGVPQNYRAAHAEYLREFMEAVKAAAARDFEAISAVLDVDSFVDFYLVNELFKTNDIADFSVFFQIRGYGDGRRLFYGPVWDFDRSSGSMIAHYSPEDIFAARRNNLFRELVAVPEIHEKIVARWNEIYANEIPQMLERILYISSGYADAFERNFYRHCEIFRGETAWFDRIPAPKRAIGNFPGQVEYLINWLEARAAWLDGFFNE